MRNHKKTGETNPPILGSTIHQMDAQLKIRYFGTGQLESTEQKEPTKSRSASGPSLY